MADSALPSPSPQCIDHDHNEMEADDANASGSRHQNISIDTDLLDDEDVHLDNFKELFSSFSRARKPKKDKTPRRLSDPDQGDGDGPQPSPTKRSRIVSIFGDPSKGVDDKEEDQPLTPSTGLGMRLSSLKLAQADGDGGDDDKAVTENIDLGMAIGQSEHDKSRRLSPAFSDDEASAYITDPVESYGLRRNINRQGAATTHIDIDQSGNYDPAEEARSKLQKARIARQNKQAQRTKRAMPRERQEKSDDEYKFKRIVKLKIKAMGNVLNITDDQDNWPDGHEIIDPEDEAKRKELISLVDTDDSLIPVSNLRIQDPTGQYEDLTGHSAARGCKHCYIEKQNCSMVTDGVYPCQECVHGKIDCDPIVTPDVFGPCKRCVENGQTCSFENANGEPQIAMCDECLEADNLDCIARPPKGYKPERIDLDRDHYGEDRKWLSCTHCREENKRCSLKKKTDKPPCKRCKNQKIGCHFYDITPRKKEKPMDKRKEAREETTSGEKPKAPERTLLNETASEAHIQGADLFSPEDLAYMDAESPPYESETQSESDKAELEMLEDARGHRGYLTTINTSFAHPMVFSVDPDDLVDCDFCEMPIFGMIGHFERQVHVIQWNNGLGYTELGNGHRERSGPSEGNSASTMCRQCTFNRLQIMVCPDHVIQPTELDEAALDYDAAAEDLMSAQGGTPQMQHELQRWCSLCFSLSTHQCCSPQPSVGANEDEEDPVMLNGCGLQLCHRCARDFDMVYQNNLHDMVTVLDKEPKPKSVEDENEEEEGDEEEGSYQGTVRADVGLLKVDGLLMMCVESTMAE